MAALVATAAALLLAQAAATASAQTGAWSRPATVLASQPLDVGSFLFTGGPSSADALGFTLGDVDTTGSALATILTGSHGRFGSPRTIAGADAVLAANHLSHRVVVLLGSAPSMADCCSAVSALVVGNGALKAGAPFIGMLDGSVQAALVPDGRRLLAVVATDRGVWASLSSLDGRRFGTPRRLSSPAESPQSLAAVANGAGGGAGATIVWSARTGGLTSDGPSEIVAAKSGAGGIPGRPKLVVRMTGGHAADELALVPGTVPELVWTESDVDGGGVFRSVVHAALLGSGTVRGRAISSSQTVAGGLSASSGLGDPRVVVAWRACTEGGTCGATAAIGTRRSASSSPVFAASRTLGAIDSDQVPVSAVGGDGTPFVGWTGRGAVRVVRAPGGRFDRPSVLARSSYLTGLTMGAAGSNGTLAAWVDGTARQRVIVSSWAER